MNRKELIKLLDKYEIEYEITDNTKEVEEGLRLFDEALKKIGIVIPKETRVDNITTENDLEVPKYTTYTTDSISRQATIIKNMLPVEPKLVSGDTISKEALIQSFLADCECKDRSEAKAVTCSLDTMLELIDDVPPVKPKTTETMMVDGEPVEIDPLSYEVGYSHGQSERPKGEWVDYTEYGYVECPFCHSATTCDGNKDELHFCFSCGADMRGDKE